MRMSTAILCVAFLVLCNGCVSYPVHTSGNVEVVGELGRVSVSINERDRQIIRKFYGKKTRRLPPGLAKKGKIPPGHRKKMIKNHAMPAGLQYRALPWELHRRLSVLPREYVRVKVGSDIVLFNQFTGIVVDVLYEVE